MKYQSVIINSNKELSLTELSGLLTTKFIGSVELNPHYTLSISTEKPSIGISDLEEISEWMNRRSETIKTIVISKGEKLTIEAQNSLLKTLEEPSDNTIIIIITNNPEILLETITSRCLIINNLPSKRYTENIELTAQEFLNSNYIKKLKIVEKLNKDHDNREEIGEFIMIILRELEERVEYISKLDDLEEAYQAVKRNVNVKLILNNLCLILST